MARAAALLLATLGVFQTLLGSGCASILAPRVPASANGVVNSIPNVATNLCFTCVKIDFLCYNHSLLFNLPAPFGVEVVKKMEVLRSSNVLYYSFAPVLEDPEYSKIGYVSLNMPTESGVIDSGTTNLNFGPFDINQYQSTLYLGGVDGIYYYKNGLPSPKWFAAKHERITNVVSKDYTHNGLNFYVYYTKQGNQGIKEYLRHGNGGKYTFHLANKTIDNFVVVRDTGYTIVYLDGTGMYAFNSKKQENPVKLSPERFIRGLTVDVKGTVYAWYVDGIYKVTIDNVLAQSKFTRVSSIVPDAMAFDRYNNIVYSKAKQLHKLAIVDSSYCLAL